MKKLLYPLAITTVITLALGYQVNNLLQILLVIAIIASGFIFPGNLKSKLKLTAIQK